MSTRYLWVRLGFAVEGPDAEERNLEELVEEIGGGLTFDNQVGRYNVYNDYAPPTENYEEA
jgi:hypothetical protein